MNVHARHEDVAAVTGEHVAHAGEQRDVGQVPSQRRIHERVGVGTDATQSEGVREEAHDLVVEGIGLEVHALADLRRVRAEQRDVEAGVRQRIPHERNVVLREGVQRGRVRGDALDKHVGGKTKLSHALIVSARPAGHATRPWCPGQSGDHEGRPQPRQ